MHISEEIFSKAQSPNLALALQTQFLDWRLSGFEKELFVYIEAADELAVGSKCGSRLIILV